MGVGWLYSYVYYGNLSAVAIGTTVFAASTCCGVSGLPLMPARLPSGAPTSPAALGDLTDQMDKLQKSEFSSVTYSAGAEQFPTFAFLAFLFLIIDIFIVNRKISWLRGINFFTKESSAKKAEPRKEDKK